MKITHLAEHGMLPDFLLRFGIRRRLRSVLKREETWQQTDKNTFINYLKRSPVALETKKANDQHYEVPSEYFDLVLGKHRKYSACHWPPGVDSLNEAEDSALHLVASRAEIVNGMNLLELGCGWGSFTLWAAAKYPGSRITAVSNSHSQRKHIERQARARKLTNIRVITADMNFFSPPGDERYDRVVSIEMFEHMHNYEVLMKRISEWLKPDGKLFVHLFTHHNLTYPYRAENDEDWMAVHFFSGGLMPSADLLLRFPKHMTVSRQWRMNGRHYSRTLEEWLTRHDIHKQTILEIFKELYGPGQAAVWFHRWRLFYLACAELFAFRKGNEWFVSHYLFEPSPAAKNERNDQEKTDYPPISNTG